MKEKKKVILIDEEDIQREYLALSESQLKLLKFLRDNDYLYHGFNYEVLEESVKWTEV